MTSDTMSRHQEAMLPWTLLLSLLVWTSPTLLGPAMAQMPQRKTAAFEGDVIIGALFSVHQQPKQKDANTRTCGEIREQYGIQRVEITFHTLDEINSNPDLLPNVTLGVEIRDSCWYSTIALEQSLEFIRDAISPDTGQGIKDRMNATDPPPDICLKYFPKVKARKNLVGVIGPGGSAVTIQVQNLLQLFNIPQIGYSATSRDLSDKNRFTSFLRVVPSDYYQAQVMVDLVRRHNWTYVSVVSTEGNYGQNGIQAFQELALKADICVAKEGSVLSNAEDTEFDHVVLNLKEDQNANVVICFCEGKTVQGLLAATRRQNLTGHFLLIGSDGWADRKEDVLEGYEEEAAGALTIRITSQHPVSFDSYYFQLRPDTNTRDPWFRDFWELRFNCTFRRSAEANSTAAYKRKCTGEEKLSDKYKPDPKMGFIQKAIYTMAHGLHNMQLDLCADPSMGLCSKMLPFNGSLFLQYLMNVSFSYGDDGELVQFDSRGDPPGRYDIMNFQRLSNGSFDYIHVGNWDDGNLTLFGELQFNPRAEDGVVHSRCSQPCPMGQYKNFQTGGQEKKCCWVCVPCDEKEFLYNDTSCQLCELGTWPNANKTSCEVILVHHMQWSDTQAIVAMALACLGTLTTLASMGVFIKYNNTPVVKASTRELSYIILVGMCLCYATTFPLLAEPSRVTCVMSRILPGLSFAMIYAALLTKTNRIARILAGSKKKIITKKPRFMSSMAQVVITFLLISIEVGIIVYMLVREPADWMHLYEYRRVTLTCNTTVLGIMAPLGFDLFLIGMCTVYAVKTRNVPENFNEAKFIGFAMYTTCVIWVAFVPIYFGSDSKVITMCLCITLSSMVTLIFLFFPKLYIILLRPERNNRSYFTTSKTVRCFIGTAVNHAVISRNSTSYSLSDYSTESPRTQSVRSFQSDWQIRRGPQQQKYATTPLTSPLSPPEDEEDKKKRLASILKRAYGSQIDIPSIMEEKEEDAPKSRVQSSFSQTGYELLASFLPTLHNILNQQQSDEPPDESPSDELVLSPRSLLNSTKTVVNGSGPPKHEEVKRSRTLCSKCQSKLTEPGCANNCTPTTSEEYCWSAPMRDPKFHILEETASDCSDTGSYEVKKITIKLGSPGTAGKEGSSCRSSLGSEVTTTRRKSSAASSSSAS